VSAKDQAGGRTAEDSQQPSKKGQDVPELVKTQAKGSWKEPVVRTVTSYRMEPKKNLSREEDITMEEAVEVEEAWTSNRRKRKRMGRRRPKARLDAVLTVFSGSPYIIIVCCIPRVLYSLSL
jgi:hypothetical protein